MRRDWAAQFSKFFHQQVIWRFIHKNVQEDVILYD